MYLIKKCRSERAYILRYPEFRCAEGAKRREQQAARRMNAFYEAALGEIVAYCGALAAENPRVLYILNGDCAVAAGDTAFVPAESEEFPLSAAITVHLALTLRLRPEPTRRRILTHTWRDGYLVK